VRREKLGVFSNLHTDYQCQAWEKDDVIADLRPAGSVGLSFLGGCLRTCPLHHSVRREKHSMPLQSCEGLAE
jgi:hypothetical protein